jgi:hypothetical protein
VRHQGHRSHHDPRNVPSIHAAVMNLPDESKLDPDCACGTASVDRRRSGWERWVMPVTFSPATDRRLPDDGLMLDIV